MPPILLALGELLLLLTFAPAQPALPETRRDTLTLLCGLATVAMAALVLATNRGPASRPDTVTFPRQPTTLPAVAWVWVTRAHRPRR